jgi:hypothetical protein
LEVNKGTSVAPIWSNADIPDATDSVKGKIKLTGALGGTADFPTVPDLITKENISNKSTVITLGTSDVFYPSQNAVKTYVDAQVASATIADADATTKGKIQLAGDLTGTAALPIVANGAITTEKIADLAITDTKVATGINASKVGLGNVDNTSDANKPISTATQTALNLKANLVSPVLTGIPTAPTAASGNSTIQLATTEFVASDFLALTGGTMTGGINGTSLDLNKNAGTNTTTIGAGSTTGKTTIGGVNSLVGIGGIPVNSSAALQVISTTKGFLPPVMSSIDRGNLVDPANGLVIFNNSNNALEVNIGTSAAPIWTTIISGYTNGDVKQGFQTSDHSGWILLNGRAISTLTPTQQVVASNLGIGANLPNATNAFLVQNGETLGAVSGSNTKIISQANLPNVNLTTISNGAHTHTFSGAPGFTGDGTVGPKMGNTTGTGSTTTSSNGAHTHTIPLNGGVSQIAFDVTPMSLSVNVFIYLGS